MTLVTKHEPQFLRKDRGNSIYPKKCFWGIMIYFSKESSKLRIFTSWGYVLLIFGERERETLMWERNIDWCLLYAPQLGIEPTTSVWALTRNWTCKLAVNSTSFQPTATWPGPESALLHFPFTPSSLISGFCSCHSLEIIFIEVKYDFPVAGFCLILFIIF